ncbi:uncharacterized protein A4U43_C02F21150 [Asparagus officinalis]|uniref:Uncharacterized protein n=1 Tax=Asparagus officinalis TaxID=4686 RepID=A0A5P1FLQ7_ASPOF|nr:uncharacterized protein LOC109831815 [Asparagus officinalis]ONK78663.1 uncharacterized protein A4U43_C02F21150 [Asparagus officinalis]
MIASSLSPSAFLLSHPRNPQNPNKTLISSPKPRRTPRKNHLRPKLPPKPPAPFENPKIPLPVQEQEALESVEELAFQSQTQALGPLPAPSPSSSILDLAFRFAALLAVQTAVAVWFFGRSGGFCIEPEEESSDLGARVRVVEKDAERGEEMNKASDFDGMVMEIREMAREAREREAKEREGEEAEEERILGGVSSEKEELNKVLGSRRRRLGFVKSNVVRRKNVGKGFNGAKKMEGSSDGDNGGVQQILHQNPLRESPDLQEPQRSTLVLSDLTEESSDADESMAFPYEKLSSVGNLQSSQETVERSKSGHGMSQLNHRKKQRKVRIKQRSKEGKHPSSTKSSNVNVSPEFHPQTKKVGKSSVSKYKDGISHQMKKPWWLQLPFVLAILMRRGSDRSCPKGLYSLQMDSPSDDEGSTSYTVVFQNQGDATNFCYLLESFFGELDDFCADVVPLTIGELEEGVRSRELKVIVVKKGQLQLYAGKPLAEVEATLRSLL